MGTEEIAAPAGFDTTRTYVQVVDRRADGFVELRFSVGDPGLFVEMMLTEAAFAELCEMHKPVILPDVLGAAVEGDGQDDPGDQDDFNWTLRDAAHRRFK